MPGPPLRRALCLAYGAGSIGSGVFSTIPGLLLLFYLTDTLAVPAALAGIAVLVPRLVDIVSDPIVGAWSDRTRTRWGRRRPFLLAGALTLPVCFIALFSAPTGDPRLAFAWVLVAFCLATTAFTLFQVPYAAMPAEITGDYHERTTLVGYRMAFLTVGILAGGALAPALIEGGGGGAAGYARMAVVLALVTMAAMLVAFLGTRRAPQTLAVDHALGLRTQLAAVLASPGFRTLLAAYALQCVALGSVLAAVPYFVRYTLGAGNDAVTVLFVCLVGPAIVTMPLWLAVSRRHGKRVAYIAAALIFAVMSASLLTVGPGPLWRVGAQVGLLGVGFAGLQVFPFAMLPELIDADARATGLRREGIFTALWFVGEKAGFALGAWLVSGVLAATGFLERRAGEVVAQPEAALLGVQIATAALPAVLAALSLPLLIHHVEPLHFDPSTSTRPNRDEANMTTLPQTGWSRDQIFAALTEMKDYDLATEGGAAFAYVYDSGEREATALAADAYKMFLGANGLDPTAFPSLLRMENQILGFCVEHLGGGTEAAGSFTSGGTESLILAVKTAREWARVHRPAVTRPQMIVPVTAHASLHKAAHYLGVEVVPVGVDPQTFKADPAAIQAALTDDTILIAASAASYAHGVIDPIAEIGRIAQGRGVLFHVDACIGGFLLPYFRRLGAPVPAFDLSVPGVTSVSMDLHKYGYAPKGASVIVYRDKQLRRHQLYACAGWTGYAVVNATVQSTKSGGPLAAAWALLHALGDDGYLELARRTLEATRTIVAGLREVAGLRVLGEPEMSLVAFTADAGPIAVFAIADAMKARGWLVQPQLEGLGAPASLHLTISAGHLPVTARFLDDLRAAVQDAVVAQDDPALAMLLQAAAAMDFNAMSDESFAQALALAGVRDGQLPDRMAGINALLNALPAAARESALIAFLNDLYVAHAGGSHAPVASAEGSLEDAAVVLPDSSMRASVSK